MRRFASACLLVSLFAASAVPLAFAQGSTTTTRPRPVRKPPVTGEARYDKSFDFFEQVKREGTTTSVFGGGVRGAIKIANLGQSARLDFAGQVDLSKFTGFTETGFLGGFVLRFPTLFKKRAFIDVMGGTEQCCGTATPTAQVGGGLDFNVNPTFKIRVSADMRMLLYTDKVIRQGVFRAGFLVPLRF